MTTKDEHQAFFDSGLAPTLPHRKAFHKAWKAAHGAALFVAAGIVNQKAEDYANDHGYGVAGTLTFAKQEQIDHYNTLKGLADELAGMAQHDTPADARNMVEGVAITAQQVRWAIRAVGIEVTEHDAVKIRDQLSLLAAPAAPAPTDNEYVTINERTLDAIQRAQVVVSTPAPAAQADSVSDNEFGWFLRAIPKRLSDDPDDKAALRKACNELIGSRQQSATPAGSTAANFDDYVVEQFAVAMKRKLAAARAKGRDGWQYCTQEDLSRMLREHVEKGDARDVANFCMFLWYHGHAIVTTPAEPSVTGGKGFPLPTATLSPMYQMTNPPKLIGYDVMVDGKPIATTGPNLPARRGTNPADAASEADDYDSVRECLLDFIVNGYGAPEDHETIRAAIHKASVITLTNEQVDDIMRRIVRPGGGVGPEDAVTTL